MKDVHSIEPPASSKPAGHVRATLTIPEHAVRVIASPPETLTQRNVEAVTGLSPRAYLQVIREPTFPLRVSKLGKLRIVNRAAFVQWLEAGEPKKDLVEMFVSAANEEPARECDKGRGDGTNELLASVGLRQRAPMRRARRKR